MHGNNNGKNGDSGSTSTCKLVYVSQGRHGPHVYTNIKWAYLAISKLFPHGATIYVNYEPRGEFNYTNVWKLIREYKFIRIADKNKYITLSKTYLNDRFPQETTVTMSNQKKETYKEETYSCDNQKGIFRRFVSGGLS